VQTRVFSEGDYWVVEVCDDNQMLIRVGYDHEPSKEEIDDLIQQLLASSPPLLEEVSS
jgi:hypothetical protein